jgi:hypothetical protein
MQEVRGSIPLSSTASLALRARSSVELPPPCLLPRIIFRYADRDEVFEAGDAYDGET